MANRRGVLIVIIVASGLLLAACGGGLLALAAGPERALAPQVHSGEYKQAALKQHGSGDIL